MISVLARRPAARALLACAGFLTLAGCGGGDASVLPLERPTAQASDDAFRRPLSVPPVYGIRPGMTAEAGRRQAVAEPAAAAPVADGQDALLRLAGQPDPRIRELIGSGPGVAVLNEAQLSTVLSAPARGTSGVPQAERRDRLTPESR
ncbi:hypothetical protein [Arenibaculum pallidiluteum]|uniref:hypothetical protein n=1 Tax=Arenibaculum pallidiluteum TaxID=2812559 RepID=UPI001A9644B0|nr:hypothetical protein [Arenibaculum pallidiluteum]